jgi:hypothetical protein
MMAPDSVRHLRVFTLAMVAACLLIAAVAVMVLAGGLFNHLVRDL